MENSTSLQQFPFKSVFSLRLLIEYWENAIHAHKVPVFAEGILEYIQSAPELKNPIEDFSILAKHHDFVNLLVTAVVPAANAQQEMAAAILPFQFKSVHATPAFERVLQFENIESQVKTNLPGDQMVLGKTIRACLMILQRFYQAEMNYDKPVLFTIKDKTTGLDKVYKVELNHQFCEIIARRTPPPIDKNILRFLSEKIYDIDLWLQYIRPDDYEFRGFMVMRLVDVTEEEMLSSIKYDLLEKDAVIRQESFAHIQQKLRSIFNLPEIRLGIAFLDPNNNLILSNATHDCWKSLLESGISSQRCDDFTGSVYERSWMEKRYITIEDLKEYPFKSVVEERLLANDVRNILLAPLVDGDAVIGMLELATSKPGMLSAISSNKVEGVLPMFTAAVKRVKEEMSTEVRALIQEECTAIHPTVQWRFFDAGLNLMNKRRKGEKAMMEEISFKDIYPLFAMADVRNSSTERNLAIQEDLRQNLKMAKDLIAGIHTVKKLPLLEEVIYKIEQLLLKLHHGFASGDESNILEFLKMEINPLVDHFEHDEAVSPQVRGYQRRLDPVLGVVYKRRKAFEESLGLINKTISFYLDEAQASAQKMFPHYFEKYQTDGVEYTLYLGSSLVRDKNFDLFYLKNFRLWQLMLSLEIDRKIETLRPRLKNNLQITQLILVHDQPVSIRFRPDEKQFDVDGAYDIRYEIVKKRIDKAYIKNTTERLTQPGKVAIVYNQTKVEDEYKRYFEYLAARKLITGEVEQLELEELPGANGLRAFRIQVSRVKDLQSYTDEELLKGMEEVMRIHEHSFRP